MQRSIHPSHFPLIARLTVELEQWNNGVRSCKIAFARLGKCLRAGHRAKLRGKDHRQFLGEGDETFMEDSGENALLHDLTTYFACIFCFVGAAKPKKVAIVACIRKLLVTINTMLKTDTTWTPKTAAMSA